MDTIKLSEVRTSIDQLDPTGFPVPFSISFWTANQEKQTGGELIEIDFAVKNFALKKSQKFSGKVKLKSNVINEGMSELQQHHAENQTTVIAVIAKDELTGKYVPTGSKILIHYRLIEKFNNKKVLW
ncbi:MAG: hypothetical protein ACOVOV_04595 [Dolichospermum sp.]